MKNVQNKFLAQTPALARTGHILLLCVLFDDRTIKISYDLKRLHSNKLLTKYNLSLVSRPRRIIFFLSLCYPSD